MKKINNVYAVIDAAVIIALLAIASSVQAEPGDIIIIRDVPAQRWDVNRHTGQPTVINPSPVRETSSLNSTLSNMGLQELTDQQFSGITSNVTNTMSPITSQFSSTLTNELGGHGSGGGSIGGHMGAINGMTSGIGGSISGSVGDATRSLGNDIRGALSDTLPGR